MARTKIESVRTAGISCIVGAGATVLGGIVVQGIVQRATNVSDKQWSYPWSSGALVPVSLLWASLHVLVFLGLLGFARSGLAGTSRGARLGLLLTLVGTALLFVGELASITIRDQRTDQTGAAIVGAIFGLAILLTAVGFLAAGIVTLRVRLWRGWRRFTPLSAGIVACALLGLNSTKALPTGVALYGLCLLALGIALYTQPTPEAAESSLHNVREQLA
jgi:hypothetical protein